MPILVAAGIVLGVMALIGIGLMWWACRTAEYDPCDVYEGGEEG
jgi:nitrogen fixation-related uncharacterized protein